MAQRGDTTACVRRTRDTRTPRGRDGQGVFCQGWLVSPKHGGPVRPTDRPRRAGAPAPGPRRAIPEHPAARVQPGAAVAHGAACGPRARNGRAARAPLDADRLLLVAPAVPERGRGPSVSAAITTCTMTNTWH